MPRPTPSAIPARALELLADDPDIQVQSKALALAILKYQVAVMERGTGAAKLIVARSYGPMLAKAMSEQGNRQTDELRAEFREVMAEMKDAAPVPLDDTRGVGAERVTDRPA